MLKLDNNSDVYGKPYPFGFFPSAFRNEMTESLRKVKDTGKTITMEALANDVQGNDVWLESALIPVLDDAGEADPTQIHQVIMNLATNALHAMEDMEGKLEVRAQPINFDQAYMDLAAGSYVKISVSDTGAGIPDIVKGKIFEPCFTTKDKGHGTGLGLSVVHGIVKSHNGVVNVYSEPGAGTTFHVYLPRAERHSHESAQQPSGQLPTGNESILVVDDEVPIVKMHQQSLERLGYKITTRSSSSVEALEAFKASPDKYDLIITDMTMPQMTGEKLAKAIKEIRPDIPVVLCTGFSERVEGHEKELAIDGILMKPIDKKEMAKIVRQLLDASKRN